MEDSVVEMPSIHNFNSAAVGMQDTTVWILFLIITFCYQFDVISQISARQFPDKYDIPSCHQSMVKISAM